MSWEEITVNEVCEEIIDCVNKTAKKTDAITPYKMIRTTNVRNGEIDLKNVFYVEKEIYEKWIRRGKPRKNDVILTREAPVGEVGMLRVDDTVFLGQRTMMYRANRSIITPHFLYYSLRSSFVQDQLHSLSSGSTVSHVRVPDAKSFIVKVPKLPTQKRIADILSAYDDLIENNLKRIKLLEQTAQNIYKEWFVHLRFPGHEQATFDKETGLPEGWEEKTFGEFTEIKKGKNITKKTIIRGNVPVVAGGLKPAYYHNTPNTVNPVITVSASGANAGYVNIYLEDIWASDCSYIDSKLSESLFFIHNLLSNQQDLIFGMQRGAAQPHVYPKDLKRAEFVIPDKSVIQKFEELVSPQYDLKRILLKQNQKLKEARDILLPRLMNRTIEV